jgi:drug/metabolite transporter (DMT)-like permease
MPVKSVLFLSAFFVCTLLANFFFKHGAMALAPFTFSWDTLRTALTTPPVLIGAGLYFAAAVAWIASLSLVPLNIAISVSAFVYVGVVLLAWLAFHEPIPAARWAGIALIALGMFVIGRTA